MANAIMAIPIGYDQVSLTANFRSNTTYTGQEKHVYEQSVLVL